MMHADIFDDGYLSDQGHCAICGHKLFHRHTFPYGTREPEGETLVEVAVCLDSEVCDERARRLASRLKDALNERLETMRVLAETGDAIEQARSARFAAARTTQHPDSAP